MSDLAAARASSALGPMVPRWAATMRATDFWLAIALVCAWAMGHAFVGIEGDGRIYMGRVLADLDPGGVGRDYMFTMDGQSGFTLYRGLARTLAAMAGFGTAVALLSGINLVAWAAGITVLARTIVPGRALGPVLAAVCVLPRAYMPWNLLAAGEAIPVPRPLAEAAVLFALAAMVRERWLVALACLIVGALFHPIMAAPGFGVLLIILGLRDRRWFAAAGAAAAIVIVAGALQFPIASRLLTRIDPEWLALLHARNPYLFLRLWPVAGTAPMIVALATIIVGTRALAPAAREIVHAAVAVAAAGLLVQFVAGEELDSLLVVQAQLWRALWLPAALAPALAGLCLVHLPRQGARGQIALALLLLAWVSGGNAWLQAIAALLAVATVSVETRYLRNVRPWVIVAVWGVFIVFALQSMATSFMALQVVAAKLPAGASIPANMVWPLGFFMVPVLALSVLAWRWPRATAVRALSMAAACGGIAAVAQFWESRTPAHADLDAARRKPDLEAMLGPRAGPVLWVEGDEVWYWARRPNWNGMTHGGGLVFSRALTMQWSTRARAEVDAGLATGNLLRPWSAVISLAAPPLEPRKIETFCGRADAPAWIVAPLEADVVPPTALSAQIWSPPEAPIKLFIGAEDVRWRRFDRYAVVPCAGALAKTPPG